MTSFACKLQMVLVTRKNVVVACKQQNACQPMRIYSLINGYVNHFLGSVFATVHYQSELSAKVNV